MTFVFTAGCYAPVISTLGTNLVDPAGRNNPAIDTGASVVGTATVADGPQGTWAYLFNLTMYAPPLWSWPSPGPNCSAFAHVIRCAGGEFLPVWFPQ
jgi:hypothetical protein